MRPLPGERGPVGPKGDPGPPGKDCDERGLRAEINALLLRIAELEKKSAVELKPITVQILDPEGHILQETAVHLGEKMRFQLDPQRQIVTPNAH